jgi:hypothetical protein
LASDIGLNGFEEYLVGLHYSIPELVTKNEFRVQQNFEKFMDLHFWSLIEHSHGSYERVNCLIKNALMARAEISDRKLAKCEEVLHSRLLLILGGDC